MSAPRSRPPRAGDRVADPRLGQRVLAADVEVALLAPDRERLDRHRLDDRERVALHEHAILERAGLGLVGVADEVVRLGRLGGDGGPLAAGREGRAAAAHEPRRGHLLDDAVGADRDGPARAPGSRRWRGSRRARSGRRRRRGRAAEAGLARLRRGRAAASADVPLVVMPSQIARHGHSRRRSHRVDRRRDLRRGLAPAIVNIAAGARSHSPRHGDRKPGRSGRRRPASPAGPSARSRSAQRSSAPASRQAMSSQTWATTGGRGFVANRA